MKRLLKIIFVTIGICTTTLVSAYTFMIHGNYKVETYDYNLSDKSLRILNKNTLTVNDSFFYKNGGSYTKLIKQFNTLLEAQKLNNKKESIKVSFLSNGGDVSVFDELKELQHIKDAHVICTIGGASSIAFTYMIYLCDERIILPDASIMTHAVYIINNFGNIFRDDSLKQMTIYQSDLEAKVLGIDKDEWYKVSREQGDKYWTQLKELKKYNIGTKYLKE